MSYLEVAEQLGDVHAIQYRAQEKIAAAVKLRKQFQDAGKADDADAIWQRMKTECLPLLLKGAELGHLRCMKDLSDYGAKLGDEKNYLRGLAMLNNVIENPSSAERKK